MLTANRQRNVGGGGRAYWPEQNPAQHLPTMCREGMASRGVASYPAAQPPQADRRVRRPMGSLTETKTAWPSPGTAPWPGSSATMQPNLGRNPGQFMSPHVFILFPNNNKRATHTSEEEGRTNVYWVPPCA